MKRLQYIIWCSLLLFVASCEKDTEADKLSLRYPSLVKHPASPDLKPFYQVR